MKRIGTLEIRSCTYLPLCEESERIRGLYIHDINDEYHDGDFIIDYDYLPESESEMNDMLTNSFHDGDCKTIESVIFMED